MTVPLSHIGVLEHWLEKANGFIDMKEGADASSGTKGGDAAERCACA